MSRSYRKPYVTDGYKGSGRRKFSKGYANNVVHNTEDIADGNAYRKVTNPWDICDYKIHWDGRYFLTRAQNRFWRYAYHGNASDARLYLTPFWKYRNK